MKRVLFSFVLALTVTLALIAPAVAVPTGSCPDPNDVYVVRAGDTVWNLSEIHLRDPMKYRSVMSLNSHLRGRLEMRRGKPIVWIYPGDEICGLKALGITPPSGTEIKPEPNKGKNDKASNELPWPLRTMSAILWLGLIAIAIGAVVVGFGFWRLFLRRDPATAGPAIVPGGIHRDQPQAVADRLDEIALRQWGNLSPGANIVSGPRPERVGTVQAIYFTGTRLVGFADRPRWTRLVREPAYQALYRFPDNTERMQYFLEVCGNDLGRGIQYLPEKIEPRDIVVPAPVPAEPSRHPATAMHAVAETAREEGLTVLRTADQTIAIPTGSVIDATERGILAIALPHGDHITVTIAMRRRPRVAAAAPAVATGTGGPTAS